jgi:hypothetical protein
MKPTTRNVLVGYGAFCAINWALTYYAARSGSPLLFGSATLLSVNESLRPFNLLSRAIDPLTVAQHHAAAAAPVPSSGAFLPGPAPTITQQPSGTTTYFD